MNLLKKQKRRKMKKFKVSLSIENINGASVDDVEERLRNFMFKARPNWKTDVLNIQEVNK